GGRFVNHYFIAILTSALLLTAITIDRIPRSKRGIAVAVGAGLFLFFGPVWSVGVSSPERIDSPIVSIAQQECHILRTIVVKRLGEGSTLPAEDLAIWLRAKTRPSDTIYIWGWDTRIAFLAQRAICSRYLHMHPIGASGFDRNARIRELARDIETRRPKYIVDESPIMPNTAPPLGSAEAPPSTCEFFRLDGYEPVKEVVAKHYKQVDGGASARWRGGRYCLSTLLQVGHPGSRLAPDAVVCF
ncbi:MAG: hypothetical protein M1335_01660, partial [Chloroflexi bacterium]|nr:hypothetical protein [Chloroflexota bacterium]